MMSSRPSPLKSPMPRSCQSVGMALDVAPFGEKQPLAWPSQLVTVPLSWRHKMSLRPSPLKSLRERRRRRHRRRRCRHRQLDTAAGRGAGGDRTRSELCSASAIHQ